jgi:hypothetical protein
MKFSSSFASRFSKISTQVDESDDSIKHATDSANRNGLNLQDIIKIKGELESKREALRI